MTLLTLLSTLALSYSPGGDLPRPADDAPDEGNVRLWGQVQTWATVLDQDNDLVADPSTYGDPEHDPGFTLARGRVGVNGLLPKTTDFVQARYGFGVGVTSPYDLLSSDTTDVQIVDAMGELLLANDFGPTALTFGVHRVPFSRGLLMSSRDLVFQERDVASNHLGHGRDAGVTLSQGIDLGENAEVGVRVGAFNGNESFLGDTDPGILVAARAELAIGRAYQTFDNQLEPALGIAANILNNQQLATNTTRLGGDLLARYKWITVTGEYLMGTIAPGDSNAAAPQVSQTINQSGLSGQLSVFIPVGSDAGGPEFAGRFATFDDDSDSTDLGDVQILHAGATWRGVVKGVDAGGGYIMRLEGGPTQLKNDTVRMWIQFRPTWEIL